MASNRYLRPASSPCYMSSSPLLLGVIDNIEHIIILNGPAMWRVLRAWDRMAVGKRIDLANHHPVVGDQVQSGKFLADLDGVSRTEDGHGTGGANALCALCPRSE
jgi:hypothetical protein